MLLHYSYQSVITPLKFGKICTRQCLFGTFLSNFCNDTCVYRRMEISNKLCNEIDMK